MGPVGGVSRRAAKVASKGVFGGLMTAVLALGAVLLSAAPVQAAPALWVMRDKDSEIYLFGTMHVLRPNEPWRTPLFDAAYARSKVLWFETDMAADPAVIQALLSRYGYDPDRALSQKLSPETLAALEVALAPTALSLAAVEHMRPWWVALILSTTPMVQAGMTPEAGADAALTASATGTAKSVRAFETLEQQIRIFADLPEAAQVQFLEDVLSENDGAPEIGADMQAVWEKGDIVALGWLMAESMRQDRPELYAAILKTRNAAWADELDERMQGKGVEMVNVGALHLVGPDGLPQMLRARGYWVERIQ